MLPVLLAFRLRILRAPPRRPDLPLGVGAADPRGALHALAGLQRLVDLEEVLDLHAVELGQVVDVAQVLLAGVVAGHAEDLGVAALLILHPEHADRAGPRAGTRRSLSAPPFSSFTRNILIVRDRMRQPGIVGWCMSTGASSGSPASPGLSSTKP